MHTLVVVCILYEYERVEYTTYRLLFSFLLQQVITEAHQLKDFCSIFTFEIFANV